jgi:hypothetical protein
MPQAFLNHLRVGPLAEQLERMAVTEVVEPDSRKSGVFQHGPKVPLGDVVAVK